MKDNSRICVKIISENGFCIYTIKPLINELINRGYEIMLVTDQSIIDTASKYLDIKKTSIVAVQEITNRYLSLLDYFIKNFLVDSKFSSQYSRITENRNDFIGAIGKLLQKIPKINQKYINYIYHYIWCILNLIRIPKKENILVITRTNNTYYLNTFYNSITLIVESWDHPVKSPFFLLPKKVFTWNESLCTDIKNFQGNFICKKIFPLKFRYIDEFNKNELQSSNKSFYQKDLKWIQENEYILYNCTYSYFSGSGFFDKELFLIKEIVKICEKNGKYLFIRPHPNFKGFEFDGLNSNNVIVGKPAINHSVSCIFEDDDQIFKVELLRNADLVINVGTTMVLEASLLNDNILQLHLDYEDFYSFSCASMNHHIYNYLLKNKSVLYIKKKNIIDIESYINQNLKSFFAKELRESFFFNISFRNSVKKVIDSLDD